MPNLIQALYLLLHSFNLADHDVSIALNLYTKASTYFLLYYTQQFTAKERSVTETNPYKIRAEQRTALMDYTAESGTTVLKSLIEVLAPQSEEKKKE